ncbi:hypothetical protein PR048_014510 [Dryococelus australis]|uniref:Uncharacterized protein n=1 Tax=Dryococelus australis TaxID=614101 RepID=A0ABQ9HF85_9NEOP|nr:hypothetical protein PR048_014510 [Dryococelus australis]
MMMFIFGVPVFQVILFCLAVGGDPWDLPLAIVNQDSDCHVATFDVQNCSYADLSCRYLAHLTAPTIVKVSPCLLLSPPLQLPLPLPYPSPPLPFLTQPISSL